MTIKGKTYKKKEILEINNYFKSIDTQNKGFITADDYINSNSKSNAFKRIAVSLFNYLDKKKTGKVKFETILQKLTPGAKKNNMEKMMDWVKQEEDISKHLLIIYNLVERGVINYKMPQYIK